MPLPVSDAEWPPRPALPILSQLAAFDAWYSGDPDRLSRVYGRGVRVPGPLDKLAQHRGGIVGAAARMWWGRPSTTLVGEASDKLHVPLAADICEASADLLYGDPPTFTVEHDSGQAVLDAALDAGLISVLSEGAEVGAALGDTYYRVSWDADAPPAAFITSVHADSAWPEFRYGRLVAVTFWWNLAAGEDRTMRHLERHEIGPEGTGVIYHGLYESHDGGLGRLIPLTEHPATAGIVVGPGGYVDTRSPGLAVVHVPNKRPQRQWRHHPVGANLGRSDLAGVESELDKIDMVYTSWMRDIRLAKSRIIVPDYMLRNLGPGEGVDFDADQDVYTRIAAPPRETGTTGQEITLSQFNIRVDEHLRTLDHLTGLVLRSAGFGPHTFGQAGDVAQTATEVDARDRRSAATRDRRIRTVTPGLITLLRKLLAVDSAVFGRPAVPADTPLSVDFPEAGQATPETLARTNQLLYSAQSASVRTRVALQHPDWDSDQVDAEVYAIVAETQVSVPDPADPEAFRGEPVEDPDAEPVG